MKLPKVFIALLLGLVIASSSWAISQQGLISSGLLGPNAHTHVTTTPARIYAITITPTATSGFAMVVETNSAAQDNAYTQNGLTGYGYWGGKETKIKADLQGAFTNASVTFEYPDGINVAEQMFVCSNSCYIEVYYKLE